ncbi:MAG: right-handed parallel beta-helix repeat-containing protein, partial [Candidatus Cloacimonetes bacterium]|nr:right-handed parallel beta-helix repeat-containing protein [Candidatus Cloacimonadota bacterium]
MKKMLKFSAYLLVILLSGCVWFESVDQPASALPGEIIIVSIDVTTAGGSSAPLFGVCLPNGWTIPGNSFPCTGVYNERIYYDRLVSFEQESASPAPEGYYWWAGAGAAVATNSGSVYGQFEIQTDNQLELFSIDYMLGNSSYGVNQERSNNHLIRIVDEYTPVGLQAIAEGNSVVLNWEAPFVYEGLLGYNIYRDEQTINTTIVVDTTFTDENPLEGIHYYAVSSLYDDGSEHLIPYEILVFFGENLYVSPDGNNSNSGSSFEDALLTINYALSIITPDSLYHKTIFLAPGIYSPSTNGEIFPLEWEDYLSLEGISEEETILDADSLSGIMSFSNITDAIIENITLRNGSGSGIFCDNSNPILQNVTVTDNSANQGGGIYCRDNSIPSLENVTISGNTADTHGGGIYCLESNPSLENVTISGNTADNHGGGISCQNDSNPILQNVTVTDNSANQGGGIYCHDNSSPSLENVTITDNTAIHHGGGIYCSNYSSPSLENVTITGNSAVIGGGVSCQNDSNPDLNNVTISGNAALFGGGICCWSNSNPTLMNVTIRNNSAVDPGGGIQCSESSPSLENVTITGNSAEHGGGISCSNSHPTLVNVTITGNSAASWGGGIHCHHSSPTLVNVTITGNSADWYGGGIYCMNNSSSSLVNCIFWNNSPEEIYFWEEGNPNTITISYSDIQGEEAGIVTNDNGTVNWLEGNIDEDPLFVGTG